MDKTTLTREALTRLLERVFIANGCSETVAGILAANVANAEAAKSYSHGVFRIEGFVSTLRSGWVDGTAVPVVEDVAPGFLRVDARNGFAQPALAAARQAFVARVRRQGVALLALRDSHHFGALWPDVEAFADEGLIALSMVNSMTCSVPAGAVKPVLGTNPIAFAAPIAGKAPLVFDFATTTMAHGDVQIAAREGRTLPEGTGVDRDGVLTGDPKAILEGGALVPFGGHKGSAISLMVELMVAGISGGNFSFEFDWSGHPGAQTPRTGQILLAIDPSHGAGTAFADRGRVLIDRLAEAGFASYPGARRRAVEIGPDTEVPLSAEVLARLQDHAEGRT
ncbi:Ldh family oxidoreductase [Pseudooceanicola nanhaiensis]|uniref:Ldh family oxidoreductase n=1 Tax=Pseudooceanicola nanhaiensis TaxID=375761 RepID=UPI001CD199E3|nr:Ldh family oxidoreductase [Pseudooceanicola nanhaiensis]MCA0921872.1 Ldh family oxidoreductase [Pseudooceanicola nanhaiensis]